MRRSLRSESGMGLAEVMMAAGIVVIIGYALAQIFINSSKFQKGAQAKDQQRELTAEIRTLLSDRSACLNSFGGAANNVVTGFTVNSLKDSLNVDKYIVAQKDKSALLTIKELKLSGYVADASPPNQGVAVLKVGLQRDAGSTDLKQDIINIKLKKNAAGNVIECFALGSVSDSFWQVSPGNASDIMYNAGKVGIGAANPASRLHLKSSFPDVSALKIEDDARYLLLGRDQISSYDLTNATASLYLGATPVTVTATGAIGIGTKTPAANLDVHVEGLESRIRAYSMNDIPSKTAIYNAVRGRGTLASPQYPLSNDMIGWFIGANKDMGAWAGMGIYASENHSATAGGMNVVISTTPNGSVSPSTRMTITNGGNVGIGTISPKATLQVAGDNVISTNSGNNGVYAHNLYWDPVAAGFKYIGNGYAGATFFDYYNGMIQFFVASENLAGSGATATILRPLSISNTGNVGIGTTIPAAKLNVAGGQVKIDDLGTATTPALGVGDNNTGIYRIAAGGGLGFTVNGAQRVRMDETGNVGIGIAGAPRTALDVNGTISARFLGTSPTTGQVCYNGVTGVMDGCTSLRKYKSDIQPLDIGLKELLQLRPVSYQLKGTKEKEIGFIAEDTAKIDQRFGELSMEGKLIGVKYDKLTSLIVKAIQQMFSQETQRDEEIEKLRQQNIAMKNYLCQRDADAPFCQ